MDESPSPYAPPKADIQVTPADAAKRTRVFSAWQAGVGAFLGGPLAGVYFLRANLTAKGQAGQATAATVVGLLASVALLFILPVVPDQVPSAVIPIAYSSVFYTLTERMKLSKAHIAASEDLVCHSGWRVAAVAITGILLFLLLFGAAALALPRHFLGQET